jgi:hypothetical protein
MAGPVQGRVVAAALGGLLLLWLAARAAGPAQGTAALIGAGAGVALYHASFGFTAAWRHFLRERRGRGLRAQALLIGLVALVSFPLIGSGGAQGVVLPVGVASAAGAALFGLGMQLGGGCGSGTLYTAGGGSPRMMVTLAAFVAGSVWATHDAPAWAGLPAWPGVSAIAALGWLPALALLLALLALAWRLTLAAERSRHGGPEPVTPGMHWLRGPWSPWAGAVGLALVAILWFLLLGQPWGITWGFAVWGAQALAGLGGRPDLWPLWTEGWRAAELAGGPLSSPVNASNLGIMLGALAAAGLAGRFAPVWRLTVRDAATAIAGGLMMGYGARLAGGCNIGAYLGGLTSGSLHGLWWLAFAWAGSAAGVRLRLLAGIDPPPAAPPQSSAGASPSA